MKKFFVLATGIVFAFVANAADKDSFEIRGMNTSNDGTVSKTVMNIEYKNGKTQEVRVPHYSLMGFGDSLCGGASLCESIIPDPSIDNEVNNIIVRQSLGRSISQEDLNLISEFVADSKMYDENKIKIRPVCEMPIKDGSAHYRFGRPCSELSSSEIEAAPYVEQDKSVRYMFKMRDFGSTYRFKLSKEERKKLRRQNIDLVLKWSER